MPPPLTTGSLLQCTHGVAPAAFVATPKPAPMVNGALAIATVEQTTLNNVATFVMCNSPTNPAVAAATSAAMGVLTPMPCVPVLTPWTPSPVVPTVTMLPTASALSTCNCMHGGLIRISLPVIGPVQNT